jgi:hypothetical protein
MGDPSKYVNKGKATVSFIFHFAGVDAEDHCAEQVRGRALLDEEDAGT